MSPGEAQQLADDWNEDLEVLLLFSKIILHHWIIIVFLD